MTNDLKKHKMKYLKKLKCSLYKHLYLSSPNTVSHFAMRYECALELFYLKSGLDK